MESTFDRVYETVSRVRSALPSDTELIGFCGASWTVAVYGDVLAPCALRLMRQAGRYLPEYREVRAKAGSFLDLRKRASMV